MPGISYSTGSSMVRIFREGSLRIDSMVASVVVLPLPVGPVMTIMPCGIASSFFNTPSSPLGDVQPGKDFDARHQRLRHDAGRRRHGAQHAVDPHAHGEPATEWLDVT